MQSNDNGELDRLIDGALSAYSSVEPWAGLEQRVLNRIQTAEAGRLRFWRWSLALAGVAAIVLVAMVLRHVTYIKPPYFVSAIPAPSRPQPRPAPKPSIQTATRRAHSRKSYPKQEQFPAPAPLTIEERALLAFVERNPEEAQEAFTGLRKRSDEPIEIQPIQIPPLPSDGGR